jgi:hypothetical protein
VPLDAVDGGAEGAGFTVVAPGDPGYEDAYEHCLHAYRAYGIPMPYADEEPPQDAPGLAMGV